EAVDPSLLEREILELGRGPDVVARELDQLSRRQVASSGVADEDVDSRALRPLEPRQDSKRQRLLVPGVAGQDDVDLGRLFVEEMTADDLDPDAVDARVQLDGRLSEPVDVRSRDCRRPGE